MKDFIIAFQFLTRFTINLKKYELSKEDLANSMVCFPIIGMLIGCFLVLVNTVLSLFLPCLVVDSFIIISLIFITKGLHLDGFSDTIDGFAAGKTKEEILEIMSDSHIGAIGVIGIFSLLILKFSLIHEMPVETKNIALILMPVLGRWAMVMAAASSDYAKETDGLGKPFTDYVGIKEFVFATITTVLIGWILFSFGQLPYKGIILILIVYLANLYLLRTIKKRIGGITGDILGALCEVTEVLVLLLIMVIL
ncbi:MAG: adenosylcobinamide-GDP ribazoletransferase [Nitrospirota bacterium]